MVQYITMCLSSYTYMNGNIWLFVLKRAVIVCLHEYLINFGYICVWVADVCAIVDMLLWEVILKSINCYGGNKRAGGNIRIQLLWQRINYDCPSKIIYPNNMRMSFEGLYNPPNVLSGGIVCVAVSVCAKHFIRCILMNLVEFLLFKLISHLVLIIQSRFRNDECREHDAYHSLFHALWTISTQTAFKMILSRCVSMCMRVSIYALYTVSNVHSQFKCNVYGTCTQWPLLYALLCSDRFGYLL